MMTPKEFVIDVMDALRAAKLTPSTKLLPTYTDKTTVIRYIYSDFAMETGTSAKTSHKFEVWCFDDDVIEIIDKMNTILVELMKKFGERGFKFKIGSPKNNSAGNQYYLSIPIEYTTYVQLS
jgi:hypothetical protein